MKVKQFTLSAVKEENYPMDLTIELEEGETITEAIDAVSKILRREGWQPSPTATQASGNVAAPASGNVVFDASLLSVMYDDGKAYFKLKGGMYTKFGATVWPEVLEAAGIDPDEVNPREGNDMSGWKAEVILKENGNPQKVVKLWKEA